MNDGFLWHTMASMAKHTLIITDAADAVLQKLRHETGGLSIGKIVSHLLTGWPKGKSIVKSSKEASP